MARLSEEDREGLLEEARSAQRRDDFRKLEGASGRRLEGRDLLQFLDWSQQFMKEDVRERGPIRGDRFLL